MELETKAVTPQASAAFDEFLHAFEQFKVANDERLEQLERRSADVVTEEKVDRINRALDDQKRALDALLIDAQRPALGGERKSDNRERCRAFDRYVRKGDTAGLDALELKTMSVGSPADGGYTVPLEVAQTIDRVLTNASPIRAIAAVQQISGSVYRRHDGPADLRSRCRSVAGFPMALAARDHATLDYLRQGMATLADLVKWMGALIASEQMTKFAGRKAAP